MNMPLASTAPQAGTTVVAITRSEGRVTARAADAKASATSYWSSGPTEGFLSFFLLQNEPAFFFETFVIDDDLDVRRVFDWTI